MPTFAPGVLRSDITGAGTQLRAVSHLRSSRSRLLT